MSDKELIFQIIDREIENIIAQINPGLRVFAPMASKYVCRYIEPYVDAFIDPDSSKINTRAAEEYLKQESLSKIGEFMKKFNEKHDV